MNTVTNNYDDFGLREKEEARDLLAVYGTHKDKTQFLGSGVQVYFNMMSGFVFLSDEDYNVAMLNVDGELEDFITCPNCGGESLASEFRDDCTDECCQEYADDMGLE
jgi:hypothetical protein